MEYKIVNNTIYLRIDKNEKVIETIEKVCEKEKIYGGYFQGIGACDKTILSTYLEDKKDFIDHTIKGMIEMISLSGNISKDNNGKPFLHSHAVFSYLNESNEITVVAGHLMEANISYTGEIIINYIDNIIERKFDEDAGIDVWKLS